MLKVNQKGQVSLKDKILSYLVVITCFYTLCLQKNKFKCLNIKSCGKLKTSQH